MITKEKRTVNFYLNGEIADSVEVDVQVCSKCGTLHGLSGSDLSNIMHQTFMKEHGWELTLEDNLDDTIRVAVAK
jgi:hypothetical protein